MNHHILTGKVDVTSNLLVGSSHLFVDTTNNRVGLVTTDPDAGLHVNSNAYVNTDLRVGSQIEINTTPGRIKATSFEGDGSLLVNAPVGSLAVHSTDTGLPGTDAIVTNEGTPTAAEFKFVIPRGDVGATGSAATIAVGTTTTGAAGSDASVTNSGTTSTAVFDFTVPKGDQGIQGIQGIQGETGTAATVAVGTTTTGAAGTNASVTNTGSSSAASFDFTIPRGDTGATGPAGTVAIGTTTTGAAGSSASVTNTGTSTAATLEFTVPKGDQGIQGVQGPAATIAVGTTTTSAPGTNGSVTNSGSSSAAVFDFTVPRGADGTNYFTLSGSDIYRSTGNVGIGVTDPDSKLEVRGNIRASFDDTNHGMFIDAGGTILRDYGGNGAGLHFTANQIFPTNYLGAYSAGGIDLGSSTYRWNNVYTEALNASGTIDSTGIITCNANKMVITGSSPTLYLRDSNARTGMIHQNDNRMYFLSGPANSDSWAQTANSRWPLYLQMDTNEAVFGGNIDAAVGTVTASTFSATSQVYLGTSASIRQTSTPGWTGNPGSGVGKIEYHSNRWYIVAGSNSSELLRVRQDGSDKFVIDNNGSISAGTVPAARITGLGSYAYKGDSSYNIHDGWLRENGDDSYVKLYGNSRSMVFRTDGNTQYGSNGGYPFVWLYGGDGTGNRRMLINTSGQLWMSDYGWLHDKFAYKDGSTAQDFNSKECYVQNWVRTRGNAGHYWEGSSNGSGWHIYPKDRADMYMRTGSGNGGLAFCIANDTVRGYIHCTTSNEIGFLNSGRNWSLRMDNGNNCQVYGRMLASGYVYTQMTARYYNGSGNNGAYTGNRPISVYAEHHMRCSELQVTSDRRIKTDIVDVDDGSALELLRKIQPKTYGYVDTMEKGTKRVFGFIAQEIKELIPEAIDVSEGDLPNIYGHATVDHEHNTITFRDFDTSNLNQTDSIIYIDQDDKRQTLKIKSVLNSTQLEIDEDLEKIVEAFQTSELEEYKFTGEIFIWGQHVDDFHHLQKSAIFTVATAALQEVDRQLQAEKEKTKNLETLVLSLITRVQKLETR